MTILPYVVDGTAESFPRLVLENSRRGPVLVNFWSPHAGPCLVLMPRLVRVLGEYGGRVFGVMIDVDQNGRLARELGIRALPMMQIFRDGSKVGQLQGVESEPALRTFIERYVSAPDKADEAYVQGDLKRAVELAAEIALGKPQEATAALRVAKLLVLDGRPMEAFALLESMPADRRSGELAALHAHLSLIVRAEKADTDQIERAAADGTDADTLFTAAGIALHRDDYARAAQLLQEVLRVDPLFGGGLGIHAILAVIALPQLPPETKAELEAFLAALQRGR